MTMGDRVAVLKDGVLQQVATPRELYETPASVFVAGFIGSPAMNLLQLPIVDGGVKFGNTTISVARDVLAKTNAKASP
jgi:multiple sugar transport system ATP-binding protein